MADFKKLEAKLRKLNDYFDGKIQTRIGVESVNHFQESFENQGFTDSSLQKWEEVERRKPESSWYGFKYKGTAKKPGSKSRGGKFTNYSPAATKRPILSGETQNLMNGIRWRANGKSVEVTANTKYAEIINEGGNMRIFGKHPAKMPKRQFMGKSKVLNEKIEKKVLQDLKKIMR